MKVKVTLAVVVAAVVTFIVVASVAGLFGSGGSGSSGGGSGASAAAGGYAASAPAAGAPEAVAGSADQSNGSSVDLGKAGTTTERDVMRTAQVSITADDPVAAAIRAGAIAAAAGGRVEQDNRDTSAHLVLRVPATRLDATLAQLAQLGKETTSQVQGDDVTAQTADVTARVQALQTSVDRLRTLLSTSGNLGDLLSVETQLTQRQAELESLQAQQRTLADQVALATITLDLVPPAAVAAAASGPTGFGGAVAGGWHGFTVAIRYLLAALGYTLPFLLLAAAAVGVVVVVRRRRARIT